MPDPADAASARNSPVCQSHARNHRSSGADDCRRRETRGSRSPTAGWTITARPAAAPSGCVARDRLITSRMDAAAKRRCRAHRDGYRVYTRKGRLGYWRATPRRTEPGMLLSRLAEARGMRPLLGHRAGFGVPDLGGILRNRAVARKFPGGGDVKDCPARPFLAIGIQCSQPVIGLHIGLQIRQVHVVIAALQQCRVYRRKNPGLIATEFVVRDHVQRRADFGVMIVMPVRVVPAAAALDLIRG